MTTIQKVKIRLDRPAPTGGIGINLRITEATGVEDGTIESGSDFVRSGDEGDRVLRFTAGETEKTVDVVFHQTPGIIEAVGNFRVDIDLLEGDDYARVGRRFDTSIRLDDSDSKRTKLATWKPGTELTVDEDTGTVTLTAESSVLFNWEVRRTIKFGFEGGRIQPTENADFTISSKRLIWPARTRTAEVELQIADDEIGEDDEWLTLIIQEPETVAGCAPDCEGIVWSNDDSRIVESDNQNLIIADNDPVRVEVTHNAGIETRITEGESFTLTAEIVPPCEPGTRAFDLNVPLTKRLGNEVLASDVPDSSSIRLESCIEPVSVTYATVDDSDDESRNDLFVSFKVGTPTPNSQIYNGDADRGKFETATDAIGFRVIDDDGYGDSLTAVPDSSTGPPETCPAGTTTHCQGREGEGVPPMKVEGPVTWDPILNDAYPNGDASNITITSVTQPANGAVVIIESGKKLQFTRDDTLKNLTDSPGNDIRVMRFTYTIEAPRHADDGGGTMRDTTDVSASIWPCDPAPCGGTGTQQAISPPRSTAASIAAESDSAWGEGDTVAVSIDWDEAVTVTGTPRVSLTLDPGARKAAYASGSGTSTLTFEYQISSSDGTVYSALLTADSLELNGGTIRDADGTDAVLDHQGAGRAYTAPRTTPKSTPPRSTAVAIDAQNDSSWKPGDPVKVRIDWNEDVTVTGTPTVALVLDGGTNRKATYSSGTATSQLVFTYEVDAADGRVYSVALTASSLALGGGSIRDDDGTAASLRHDGRERAYTPPPPLTVSWTAPDEHGGGTFMFEVEFSDELAEGYSYRTLRDQTLTATGGRVTKARRLQPGGQREWEITVEPDATTSDVALRLEGAACGAAAAVCTADGRALSNSLGKTVAGPAGVSVADAEVEEGDDAEVSFTVTLSKAATRTASVDYATQNGTATSGDDYTATSGTLTFAAGETSKTVAVEVLDDDHDEGSESFKLVLSNPSNAVISDAEGTGTIRNRDPLPRALLARFGRAAAVHVVEQIQQRIDAPRNPATSVRLAGHEVGGLTDAGNAVGLLQSLGSMYGVAGAQTLNGGYGAVETTGMPMAGYMGMSSGIAQGAGMGFGGPEGLTSGIGSVGSMPGAMQPAHEQVHRPNLLARSEFAINRATGDGGSIAFWEPHRGVELRRPRRRHRGERKRPDDAARGRLREGPADRGPLGRSQLRRRRLPETRSRSDRQLGRRHLPVDRLPGQRANHRMGRERLRTRAARAEPGTRSGPDKPAVDAHARSRNPGTAHREGLDREPLRSRLTCYTP